MATSLIERNGQHAKLHKVGVLTSWTEDTPHEDIGVPASVVNLQFRNHKNYDDKAPDGTDPYLHCSAEALTIDYDSQLARLAVFYADMPIPTKQQYFSNPA